MTNTTYVFKSSVSEADRLRIQAQVWRSQSNAMLQRIDPQRGWNCLDLGCGPQGILDLLSHRVGSAGRVVGVELNEPQVSMAQSFVATNQLTNVTVLQGDAYDTKLPSESFDLTHVRMLFAPAGRWDELLSEALRLTRPGGILAVEEPDQTSWNYYPEVPSFLWFKKVLEEAFRKRGTDVNVGQQMYGMLRRAGLEQVQARAASLAFHDCHPYMQTPLLGLAQFRPALLKTQLASEEELEVVQQQLEEAIKNPETLMVSFSLLQVWGLKT